MKKILGRNVLVKVTYKEELPSGISLPSNMEIPKTRMAEILEVGDDAMWVEPKDQVILRQFGLITTPIKDKYIIDERNILVIMSGE